LFERMLTISNCHSIISSVSPCQNRRALSCVQICE
jgi:hypothetical protein